MRRIALAPASVSDESAFVDADTRLAAIIEQLAGPRRDIERTFLSMGERLMSSTKLLNEISRAHEGMPAELESDDFAAGTQLLQTIRDQVEEMKMANSKEQVHVGKLNIMAAGVAAPLDDLRRTIRTIRLIAVNARIAAAYVSGHQADVGTFTEDMTALGEGAQQAISAFAAAFEMFVASLSAAYTANAAFSTRHGGTMAGISGRLASHIEVIGKHRILARSQSEEHAQLTSQIRKRIATAVAALQTGDIVRQRVEHVEQALASLSGPEAETGAGTPDVHAHTTSAVLHLQAAQLDETIAELDQQLRDLTSSLRILASDAAVVFHAGNAQAEALISDGGTALNAMISDLSAISELFADFAKTRAGIEKAANEVARSVDSMVMQLDAIASIEQQIRMVSLNTTIHCGRLGEEGSALKVIAVDLRELALQTVAAAGSIMTNMSEADSLARVLSESSASGIGRHIAQLEEGATKAASLFNSVVVRLHDRAATIAASGPRTMRELEAAANSVSGRQGFIDNWRDARMRIASLAPLTSEAFDGAVVDPELTAKLRARYTMDSERHIHDALLGTNETITADHSTSTAETDLDDFLF